MEKSTAQPTLRGRTKVRVEKRLANEILFKDRKKIPKIISLSTAVKILIRVGLDPPGFAQKP